MNHCLQLREIGGLIVYLFSMTASQVIFLELVLAYFSTIPATDSLVLDQSFAPHPALDSPRFEHPWGASLMPTQFEMLDCEVLRIWNPRVAPNRMFFLIMPN